MKEPRPRGMWLCVIFRTGGVAGSEKCLKIRGDLLDGKELRPKGSWLGSQTGKNRGEISRGNAVVALSFPLFVPQMPKGF